jgi:amidohydrolase
MKKMGNQNTFRERLYQSACLTIDRKKRDLIRISKTLHEHPEIAFEEKRAAKLLTDFLAENGFGITPSAGGLETAFVAQVGQKEKPVVAFMAEYDALPQIGHGCGHNLIAAASVGAGIALLEVIKELQGEVRVIGTPAEEGGGGKIILCREGIFNDVDAALMVHPGCKTEMARRAMTMAPLDISFHGKSAHAAALPHEGKNALDGVILTFNNINALRQQMKPEARVHGIITHGGDAPNIIPDYAAARFFIRALDVKYTEQLLKKVSNCAKGAAQATGTRVTITPGKEIYHPLQINYPLVDAFAENLRRLKIKIHTAKEEEQMGSSDVGNVSWITPTIHPTIAITPRNIPSHSVDFAHAAATDEAQEKMIVAAKALAMTGIDFLSDPALRKEVTRTFQKRS